MRKFYFFILVIFSTLSLGMGGNNQEIISKIPEPDRIFKVLVIDRDNTSYEVNKLSIDGLTFLPVQMGRAQAGIDFKSIKKINFYLQDDKVLGRVKFNDNLDKEFYLDPQMTFFGQTRWGNIKLKCKDIKEIKFKYD